jgi:hypothetical protein
MLFVISIPFNSSETSGLPVETNDLPLGTLKSSACEVHLHATSLIPPLTGGRRSFLFDPDIGNDPLIL